MGRNCPESLLSFRAPKSSMTRAGPARKAIRQPVILKALGEGVHFHGPFPAARYGQYAQGGLFVFKSPVGAVLDDKNVVLHGQKFRILS